MSEERWLTKEEAEYLKKILAYCSWRATASHFLAKFGDKHPEDMDMDGNQLYGIELHREAEKVLGEKIEQGSAWDNIK